MIKPMLACGALAAALCVASAGPAAASPGTLLSAEPLAGAPAGARAWRIRYLSTGVSGRPEEVTGFVAAPDAASAGPRPVLAWAHGSWGVASKCAPSTSTDLFAATPGLAAALARGFTVVATDYAGLGTPQPHPYLIGDASARNVLDAVRAARRVPGLTLGSRFAAWGESQGGHAALFTGELARAYAPELRLVGVAAAAPPTDLVANLGAGGDPSVRAFLTAYVAHSWSRALGAPLSALGRPATGRLINRLAANCIVLGKPPKLGTVIGIAVLRRDLKGVDFGRTRPWGAIARANSAGKRPQPAPLLIVQNENDVIVSPAVTRAYARRQCRAGVATRFISLSTKGGHPTSAADSATETLDWIAGRFAGAAPPSDCRSGAF